MLEKISDHIKRIVDIEPAVAKQFVRTEQESDILVFEEPDPLLEDDYEVVRGLIHKYRNRVLCLLTPECAAYCRFCTRRRKVSDVENGRMSEEDILRWTEYLGAHTDVEEAILSGGDPLVAPAEIFSSAVKHIAAVPTIKLLRIGTRVPVTAPEYVTDEKLDIIRSIEQPVYVGIHFEHPFELTKATVDVIRKLRKAGAILYSQTVFLAGVNDDYATLYELFSRLVEIGVRPYYIYRCDPVAGAGHFRTDFETERKIMTELRKNLSGLACPTYVIDTPHGSGKIPVPLEFWGVDYSNYSDFNGVKHHLEEQLKTRR
ncbi:MAG: KamA family radical SAM protein [Armatimonadota bacterium]